ncbi:hypothetical protein R5R35_007233 [Gryllus longicercus]|uniref:MADF domain-containing protein n=1 Tax=Gryllus longicercus TaxID=2509291 RepID=A0AAN9V4U3_9ORTH
MEETLIEAVRCRQVLYDTSHKDYLRTKLKAQKWEEVAKEVGIQNGDEAKALWEKLRHSLRDALRRQQKCLKIGTPAQSIKQWKFQKHLSFLLPYMASKTREGNLDEDSESAPPTCGTDDSPEVVEGRVSNVQQGIRSAPDEAPPLAPLGTSSATPAEIPTPTAIGTRPAKRRKIETVAGLLKRSMEQHEERRKRRSEERERILEQLSAPSDSLYHFFLSMYEVTKTMPLSSQFAVRNNVFRVVTDMEATLLNIPAEHSHRAPQSNTVQRTSFHECQYSNRTPGHSWTRSSTPDASSLCDTPMRCTLSQTCEGTCEIEPNTSTTGSVQRGLVKYEYIDNVSEN